MFIFYFDLPFSSSLLVCRFVSMTIPKTIARVNGKTTNGKFQNPSDPFCYAYVLLFARVEFVEQKLCSDCSTMNTTGVTIIASVKCTQSIICAVFPDLIFLFTCHAQACPVSCPRPSLFLICNDGGF